MQSLIQGTQEVHRVEILPAAVAVGDPFTGLAAVVEVEHRGHGVHAQGVDMKTIEPEHRVAK